MIRGLIDRFAYAIDRLGYGIKIRAARYKLTLYPHIDASVRTGPNVQFIGPRDSITIGSGSYINEAMIVAGDAATVSIGKQCAIGYRVSIKALTHVTTEPHPDENGRMSQTRQLPIKIGNYCWIGDNVYIREGVTIGNNVIVGANSVVVRSAPDNVVLAGAPAVIIRHNAEESALSSS
jgi:maltose O-acetyltransferase